ncbi:MAG TPA: penicillin acylase family protein, partial [Anaerolineales bacterium]
MKMRGFLSKALIVVLVIAILLGAGGAFYFRSYLPGTVAPQSFPIIDGEVAADGLDSAVDIYRDRMGVAHVYASSLHDLFFAQGYVHAQDRFWQMDAWRHIGSGRLSEMFGSGQLETDAFLRTLGWRKTAEQEWDHMGPDSRAILQAYADGVNAYLKDHDGTALSLEYAILKLLTPGYEIEPWEPVNSLTWGKAMAWDLRGNLGEEIERTILLKSLGAEHVDELFPAYPADHPLIVNQIGEGNSMPDHRGASLGAAMQLTATDLEQVQQNLALLDPVLGALGDGLGSNSWVIGGEHTTTGKPLLANDPHLAIQLPSIWYQMTLHCQPRS